MSKHTPGPWHAYSAKAEEEEQVWWVDGDEGEPICDLYRTLNGMETIPKANGFANARLISAAPDMAEALKKARDDAQQRASILRLERPNGWEGEEIAICRLVDIYDAALKKAGIQ